MGIVAGGWAYWFVVGVAGVVGVVGVIGVVGVVGTAAVLLRIGRGEVTSGAAAPSCFGSQVARFGLTRTEMATETEFSGMRFCG